MPTYEFRCNDCQRKVTIRYKTYAAYDEATPACPHCASTDLTRLISRVAIKKSTISRLVSGGWEDADDTMLDDLEHSDPRTMGEMLRAMSDETGEDMGPEFDEIVTRLERGESPDEIESTLPDPPGDNPLLDSGDDS
jgi:putative FmdB family regulatory protein